MSDSQAAVPEGWNKVKLQDLVSLDREKLTEGTNADFSFYYIDIASVSESFIQFPSTKIAFRGSPSRARKVVHSGDVLMATVRPNLKAFAFFDHTDDNCIASTGFAVLTAKQDVDPRFVLYSILSDAVSAQVEAHVVGSNYPAINSKDIRRLKILAPPPHEQRKIARILTTLDNLIENTEALIAKYQAIKQGMMHDLFTRGLDAHGHQRPPQAEAPGLYKESEHGWIPKEWETTRLEALSELIVDCPHSTPEYLADGILVARTTQIKDGRFDSASASFVSEAEYLLRISRLEPRAGDLILTREAPVGEAFVVPDGMRICLGQRVMLVRLNLKKCDPHFVLNLIYSSGLRRRFDQKTGGTTNPHLNVEDVRSLQIVSPPIEEQVTIGNRMMRLAVKVDSEIKCLEKLRHVKTGLVQDLLTGNVRVKADESEEASADA